MGMSHPRRDDLTPERAPSIEQTHAIMQKLCDIWDDGIRGGKNTYRGDLGPARAVAIRTHAHHAVRLARAVLEVDRHSRGIEIVPLSRLIFECAVTAAWSLVMPGSEKSFIRDGARKRRAALESAAMPDGANSPALKQALQVIDDLEGAKSFAFEQRCLSLAGGETLYLTYRVMSAESHAGLGIADFYAVEDPNSEIGISFNPHASSSVRAATMGLTACMLFLAINADELARAKPHRTTQLAKAAKQLGVGTQILRSDTTELSPRA